jgi:hypothetical protein
MTLANQILSDPVAVSLLTIALIVILLAVRYYVDNVRQAREYERLRVRLFRLLDPLARKRGRPLIRDKTGSGDYIVTADASVGEVTAALWDAGYRWNPTSQVKYRVRHGGREFASLEVAYRDSPVADTQHDVYLFGAGGVVDVYGHREANVTDPTDHVGGDEQVTGDPTGRVRDALARAGISYRVEKESVA